MSFFYSVWDEWTASHLWSSYWIKASNDLVVMFTAERKPERRHCKKSRLDLQTHGQQQNELYSGFDCRKFWITVPTCCPVFSRVTDLVSRCEGRLGVSLGLRGGGTARQHCRLSCSPLRSWFSRESVCPPRLGTKRPAPKWRGYSAKFLLAMMSMWITKAT